MTAGAAPRRRPKREVSGILLLDKPAGISSNAALQRVRSRFHAAKGGHTGNLDVAATGLLPICLGEATKVSAWLLDSDKRYEAAVLLGRETTTGDAEGEVVAEHPVTPAMLERLPAALAGFVGDYEQVPPMYSALKRDGRPLYELARAGIEVPREARCITFHELTLRSLEGQVAHIGVHCSKGTYIRVLAEDLGRALGCGGSLIGLRRTASGPFALDDALTLGELDAITGPPEAFDHRLLPADAALVGMPALVVGAGDEARLRQGLARRLQARHAPGFVRIYRADGLFVGLAEVTADGCLQPRRLINLPGSA